MGAESQRRRRRRVPRAVADESGQSIIEFLVTLPVLVTITLMLVRVNSVIQMSLVNQKYARSHALFLTYNSPVYPARGSESGQIVMGKANVDVMIMGVSDNLATAGGYLPEPSKGMITRPGAPIGNDSDPEPLRRGKVRVRTTVALCTQTNSIGDGAMISSLTFQEDTRFSYCRRPRLQ